LRDNVVASKICLLCIKERRKIEEKII
jgi:hypothetical protein